MLGVVLSFLMFQDILFATRPNDVVSFEDLRALCVRETRFDFCGPSFGVKTNAIGFSERDLQTRLSAGVSHYVFRREFQELLESLDRSASGNDRRNFSCISSQIRALLERQVEKAKEENERWLLLYRSMERVLYEIARLSESGFPCDANDLDLLLPEHLFMPPPKKIYNRTYCLIMGFKKLLVIGQKIRQYRIVHGFFPRTVDDMNLHENLLRLENGTSLHYETDGKAWHLWYGGARCNMRFNVYIPTLKVEELAKWPFGGCPNYSSDYSRKRVLAYRDGCELNSQFDLWRCELINGKFCRKR